LSCIENIEYNLGPENINLMLWHDHVFERFWENRSCVPPSHSTLNFRQQCKIRLKWNMNIPTYIHNKPLCLPRPFFLVLLKPLVTVQPPWQIKKTTDNPNRALFLVHIIITIIILETTNMVCIRDTFSIIIFVISYYYYTHSHCMMPPNDAPQYTILNQTNF